MASCAGYSLNEFLDLTPENYRDILWGYNMRRQVLMNDISLAIHHSSGKISAAIWGDKNAFSKPLDPIDFVEDDLETQEERLIRKRNAALRRMGLI